MAAPVAGQKGHALSGQCADADRVAGIAERRLDGDLFDVGQLLDVVQSAAADDSE